MYMIPCPLCRGTGVIAKQTSPSSLSLTPGQQPPKPEPMICPECIGGMVEAGYMVEKLGLGEPNGKA